MSRRVTSMSAGGDNALDTRKHVRSFAKNFSDYAETFGVTDRAIRRWVRIGKERNDLPPLDQPHLMAPWYANAFGRAAPASLLAHSHSAGVKPEPPPAVTSSAQSTPPPDTSPRDFSGIRSLSIEENVEAMRVTLAITKHLLDDALKGRDENLVTLRQKNYANAFDKLRLAETSLIEIQKQRGDLIDKEGVRTELAQLCESLRLMRDTMPRRIIVALEAHLPRRLQRVLRLLEKYLIPAIEKSRASEDEIFRKLEGIEGPAAVMELLAA